MSSKFEEHTPGPWTFAPVSMYDNERNLGVGYVIGGQAGHPAFRSETFTRPIPDVVRNDAALIAAAPDLLALCEQMRGALSWMADNAINIRQHPELYSGMDHHVIEARAALTAADKVLGRE